MRGVSQIKGLVLSGIRCLHDSRHRAAIWAELLHPDRIHQTTTLTSRNRYGRIFDASRRYFEGRENLRILSYGCSTGEEVLTLREYFPHATIIGAEINRACLRACNRLQVDSRISFVYSDPAVLQQLQPFDAIFCMAVLQRTPDTVARRDLKSLKELYPYNKFDRQVSELVGWLAPGGLLAVRFSHYRVCDSTAASHLDPLPSAPIIEHTSPMFDRHSCRIEQPTLYCSIHVKKR